MFLPASFEIQARDDGHKVKSGLNKDSDQDHTHETMAILIPITVLGWLLFGVICMLCVNKLSRGSGWWTPGWYRNGEKRHCKHTKLALWWIGFMLFWPLILPFLFVKMMIRVLGWCVLFKPSPLLSFLKLERTRKKAERLAKERADELLETTEVVVDAVGVVPGGEAVRDGLGRAPQPPPVVDVAGDDLGQTVETSPVPIPIPITAPIGI